jgi:hypothetical protein
MRRTTRRALLASAGALGLSTTGWAVRAQDKPLRIRRNIRDLGPNDDDVSAYRIAVSKMRASGAWDRQVAIHADMSLVHHSSWRFLPWHRLQLVHLERIVAKVSGKDDFAMPYWDWADDRIPEIFVDDPVFRMDGRECAPQDSIAEFLTANKTKLTDRSRDDFGTFFGRPRQADQPSDAETGHQHFSGSGEWSGHNLIHSFVGGDMGRLDRSPNDPIFWLHHANVDRIWAVGWGDRHSNGAYPDDWEAERLSGYVEPDGSMSPEARAIDTISTTALGYDYGRPAPAVGAGRAFPKAPRPPRIVHYTFEMTRLGPGRGVIELPPEARGAMDATATGYLKIDPDPSHSSVLRVSALDLTEDQTVFDDKVFQVAMGMKTPVQGYRLNLNWGSVGPKGLRIEAETGPLVGRKAGPHPPALVSFVVEAQARFYD